MSLHFKEEVMDGIKKEELTGLRNPTDDEIEKVSCHASKECRSECRIFMSTRIFLDILGVPCIIAFLEFLYQGGGSAKTVKEAILALFLGVFMLFGALKSKKVVTASKNLLTTIKNGDFQVIDCYSTKMEYFSGGNGSSDAGIVYLETVQGQACSDKFIISAKDAYANKGKAKVSLLLVVQKEFDYYEVLIKENEK